MRIFYFLVAISLFQVACSSKDKGSSSSCGDEPLFTVSPLADSDITGIVPLGNLNPGGGHIFPTDHIYFYIKDSDGEEPVDEVDVKIPGDAVITKIAAKTHLSADPVFVDYRVTMEPCDDYELYFSHVQSLSAELSAQITGSGDCSTYATGGQDYQYCRYENLSISVKAGDVFGTAGGTVGQAALDLGVYDSRQKQNTFANEERLEEEESNLLYAKCPIDDFESTVKAQLENRFGDYDGSPLRTVEPVCGEVSQDEIGTAQGIWFFKSDDSLSPEDPHIALVHNNVDPTIAVFSVGTELASALSGSTLEFTPEASGLVDREFSDVTDDGNIYCYTIPTTEGVVLLQMTSSTEIDLEYQASTECSDSYSFTSAKVSYIR